MKQLNGHKGDAYQLVLLLCESDLTLLLIIVADDSPLATNRVKAASELAGNVLVAHAPPLQLAQLPVVHVSNTDSTQRHAHHAYLLFFLLIPCLLFALHQQRVLPAQLLAGNLLPPLPQRSLAPVGHSLGHVRPAQLEPAPVHVRPQRDQL